MRTSCVISKRDYIIEFLETAGEEHQKVIRCLLSESDRRKCSFLRLLKNQLSDRVELIDEAWAFEKILVVVTDYVRCYHAPAAAKQKLYSELYALCKHLGQTHNIRDYLDYLNAMQAPVADDITIALIKHLHSRNGITKEEFAEKYRVDKKTVQNRIQSLSGNPKYKPTRIAGHMVHVPVKATCGDRKRDEDKRYYTPNTMNPVILQLNTTQVASLLQSFFYSNNEDNIIPMDLAIDVWCQLSEYTKERIRAIFCKNDAAFSAFIEEVNSESQSLDYKFMTESEMLDDRDLGSREQLSIAEKGMICDIVLLSPYRTRKKQSIYFDPYEGYYVASSVDNPDDRITFTIDEFHSLSESV